MRAGEFAAVMYNTCHRLGPHAVVTIPFDDDDVYIGRRRLFVPWTDFFLPNVVAVLFKISQKKSGAVLPYFLSFYFNLVVHWTN